MYPTANQGSYTGKVLLLIVWHSGTKKVHRLFASRLRGATGLGFGTYYYAMADVVLLGGSLPRWVGKT